LPWLLGCNGFLLAPAFRVDAWWRKRRLLFRRRGRKDWVAGWRAWSVAEYVLFGWYYVDLEFGEWWRKRRCVALALGVNDLHAALRSGSLGGRRRELRNVDLRGGDGFRVDERAIFINLQMMNVKMRNIIDLWPIILRIFIVCGTYFKVI
jgi:hypothetical protein